MPADAAQLLVGAGQRLLVKLLRAGLAELQRRGARFDPLDQLLDGGVRDLAGEADGFNQAIAATLNV